MIAFVIYGFLLSAMLAFAAFADARRRARRRALDAADFSHKF